MYGFLEEPSHVEGVNPEQATRIGPARVVGPILDVLIFVIAELGDEIGQLDLGRLKVGLGLVLHLLAEDIE